MIDGLALTADAFVDEVIRHVATWPQDRIQFGGFDLLVGDTETVHVGRMHQARRILVTQHILESLPASAGQPIMLMKGLEIAHLYPELVSRPFRDVDLLMQDGMRLWTDLVARGLRQHPARRADVDHHHLPALQDLSGTVGIEVHQRPNVPRWASISPEFVLSTGVPSRTGAKGIFRPRDDVHALLIALHCWKGGFTRLRDLFDALLLASASEVPVDETAASLGLGRFWKWTVRFAQSELLGRTTPRERTAARLLIPTRTGTADRKRSRVLAPFLVAVPWRVAASHVIEYRLGREARHSITDREHT